MPGFGLPTKQMYVNAYFWIKCNAALALPSPGPKSSSQLLPSATFQRCPIFLVVTVFRLNGIASSPVIAPDGAFPWAFNQYIMGCSPGHEGRPTKQMKDSL